MRSTSPATHTGAWPGENDDDPRDDDPLDDDPTPGVARGLRRRTPSTSAVRSPAMARHNPAVSVPGPFIAEIAKTTDAGATWTVSLSGGRGCLCVGLCLGLWALGRPGSCSLRRFGVRQSPTVCRFLQPTLPSNLLVLSQTVFNATNQFFFNAIDCQPNNPDW